MWAFFLYKITWVYGNRLRFDFCLAQLVVLGRTRYSMFKFNFILYLQRIFALSQISEGRAFFWLLLYWHHLV